MHQATGHGKNEQHSQCRENLGVSPGFWARLGLAGSLSRALGRPKPPPGLGPAQAFRARLLPGLSGFEPGRAKHAAYASWVSQDLKAQLQIATTLRKGALNVILQANSAKDCWDRLNARYQGRGNCHVAYLMQSFYRMPLTDTEPMEPQLNKLVEANRNLETIRCGVNDKALAYIIVMALLDSLSTLQAILFNNNNVTITSEAVVAQILADEE